MTHVSSESLLSSSQFGANAIGTGVEFRVWAPNARERVEVRIEPEGRSYPLDREEDGYWSATVPGLGAGARYRFALDGGDAFPDPCSRSQPAGVHGPSEVVDPAFAWRDDGWRGLGPDGQVIYECHVGTMTPEGTFAALERELPALRDLGVTAVELMPVAAFPGRWNWGYDGVSLWAPSANYGTPADLRHLVDAAHAHGLGVILDVVYNHLGPDGNYLRVYAEGYFTGRHHTPWGEAINYDGPGSRPVREFVIGNALHWLTEYHVDGLRLDATHAIIDDSPTHVIAELTERARAAVAPREIFIVAEDGRNDVAVVHPRPRGGWGCDAVWADDFHHEVHVALTGERDGYYGWYEGTPASIAGVIAGGFTFQGQETPEGEAHGTKVTDEPARAFVFCLQNHDQVGNRATGDRLNHIVDRDTAHVAAALMLLAPETPMLFMGEEFRAGSPFQYFTDHDPELGKLVTEGRRSEFAHFAAFADEPGRERVPDPQAETTFRRSKLDLSEREAHGDTLVLYRELIRLRREDPVLSVADRAATRTSAHGEAILIHRSASSGHRLTIANFGGAREIDLAPVLGAGTPDRLAVLLDTGEERFGGAGTATVAGAVARVPAKSAVLLGW